MKNLGPILLVLLVGCSTHSTTLSFHEETARSGEALKARSNNYEWVKVPSWYEETCSVYNLAKKADQPTILVSATVFTLDSYHALAHTDDYPLSLRGFRNGTTILGSEEASRVKKFMSKYEGAICMNSRLLINNGQKGYLMIGGYERNRAGGMEIKPGYVGYLKPVTRSDGKVYVLFSFQGNGLETYWNLSDEATLAPGQWYLKVLENEETDTAIILLMNVPMVSYPALADNTGT